MYSGIRAPAARSGSRTKVRARCLHPLDGAQECQYEKQRGKEREDKRPHSRIGRGNASDSGQTECDPMPASQRKRGDEDQRTSAAQRSEPEEQSTVPAAERPSSLGDAAEDEGDTQCEG